MHPLCPLFALVGLEIAAVDTAPALAAWGILSLLTEEFLLHISGDYALLFEEFLDLLGDLSHQLHGEFGLVIAALCEVEELHAVARLLEALLIDHALIVSVQADELRKVRRPILIRAFLGRGTHSDEDYGDWVVTDLNDGLFEGIHVRDFPVGKDDDDVVELVLLAHLLLRCQVDYHSDYRGDGTWPVESHLFCTSNVVLH